MGYLVDFGKIFLLAVRSFEEVTCAIVGLKVRTIKYRIVIYALNTMLCA